MKKFRFLFVVAVIAAIFVVPSFAAFDGLDFCYYDGPGLDFYAPSFDSIESSHPNANIFVSISQYTPATITAYASDLSFDVSSTSHEVDGALPRIKPAWKSPEDVPIYKYRISTSGDWVLSETIFSADFSNSVVCHYANFDLGSEYSFIEPIPFDLPDGHIYWDGDTSLPERNGSYRVADKLDDDVLSNSIFCTYDEGYLGFFNSTSYVANDGSSPYRWFVFNSDNGTPGLYFKMWDSSNYVSHLFYPLPDPMGEIMDSTTSIFDAGVSMMSSVANAVTSSPLILLVVLIPLIFVGVSLFRRFMKI